MGILASEKFKPTLFVGLGGNGGKIVDHLARRLKRHPNWGRIEALTHFLVIDTNQHDLDGCKGVRPDCRFLVSNFDARSYVDRKRGNRELSEDPLLTQWFPGDYVPRLGMGPGAGQIRIESRLKLWYNLEEDRAGIRRKVASILEQMTSRENPWRDNEDRVVRVMLYASVAGGTGSGGFLPMAYLLRKWVEDAGWGRPNVVSVLSLPTTFLSKVRPELHKDIAANGYAALKELEYVSRQLGYAGGMDEMEFHFEPGTLDRSGRFIHDRPFTLVYLVDRPDEVSIEKYEHAVADASYLQIFSPLLGAQASEYDNYEKHQRQLALGHFSVHYGAFGTALLHLPRNDLLRYSSMRYVSRALRDFLSFGGEDQSFAIPYGDPAFERLAEVEKNKRIDDAFDGYVAWRAQVEADADEKGIFSEIHGQTGKGGKDLQAAFQEHLQGIFGRLDELIDIPDVERQAINPGNPSISRSVAVLRKSYAESRSRVRGQYLEAQLADLRNGRFFTGFFSAWEVNPIAQRLFLVRLLRSDFITPFSDPVEGEFLRGDGAPPVDLEGGHVQSELGRIEADLGRTAQQSFFKRLADSENKAFLAAKTRAIRLVEELSQDCREELRRYFWRTFESELRKIAETLLSTFRKVSQISDEQARLSDAETERFRRDPASFADSDVAQYYLDAEVLRDDRRRERLWSIFYLHHLDKAAFFDLRSIFQVVTEAFQPVRDPDGRVRARDASEVVAAVKVKLLETAGAVYGRALEDVGLDLARGLDLEQRYISLLDGGADLAELRRLGKLDGAVSGVSAAVVRRGIEDRLKRLRDECAILAHIDASRRDDPTVVPADVFYAAFHERFATDEEGSLGEILRGAISGVNFVPGWSEPDSLVFYRAALGIPIYWFKNVQTELYPAYRKVFDSPTRSYPLHIQADWEKDPGLPNLDPLEIRRAEERRQAERKAQEEARTRAEKIRIFTQGFLFGALVTEGDGYAWSLPAGQQTLARTRAGAFAAFEALNSMLRQDLVKIAQDGWTAGTGERLSRQKLLEEVKAHGERVKQLHTVAVMAGQEAEMRFLEEERAVISRMAAELER